MDAREPSSPLTLGQLLALNGKIKRGDSLTDVERRQYDAANEAVRSTVRGLQMRYAQQFQELRPAIFKLSEGFRQFSEWAIAISERLAPVLADLAVGFQKLPSRIQAAILTLGESGWYLDGEMGMSALWEIEGLLHAGEVAKVDRVLMQHFEGRLSKIEEYLCNALPKRKKILHAALAAHHRGEYELSIPTLLAQSDGACFDLTGYVLFARMKDGKRRVANRVNALKAPFSSAILSPLINPFVGFPERETG